MCIQEICLFIGFCNFYRQFIRNFLNIAGPLNTLTKKDRLFAWTTECKQAFQELKNQVCENPILCYFDLNKQCFVKTDFSDYLNASMLSQMGEDNLLHPVAYFLRKMMPAKCHYKIYDKKLFAIIRCFEEWRPELEGTGLLVKVLTNYKGLEYFMSTKKLTPRQVKWAKFLSEFNFVISYQSGKKNDKANTLMRKPNKQPINDENKQCKHSVRVLLSPNQIDHEAELQLIEENHANQTNSDTDSNASDETSPLPEQVMESNWNNELCSEIYLCLTNPEGLEKPEVYLKNLRVENRLLIKENWLWVADKDQLQLKVIKEIYDQPAIGYPGTERTLGTARRHYYWPGMKEMIQQFIHNCHVCKQAKAARNNYHSLLQPLSVPEQA